MRSWMIAGAFDAGHIRGYTPDWEQELDFHQLEMTGHAEQLESDYRLFREEFGLTLFRDGAWLAKSYPGPGRFDWSYLDRLAGISDGQVTLSLFTATLGGVSGNGRLCATLLDRAVSDGVPSDRSLGSAVYDLPSWPGSIRRVTFTFNLPDAEAVPAGNRLVLALHLREESAQDVMLLYDHPLYRSLLEVATPTPL